MAQRKQTRSDTAPPSRTSRRKGDKKAQNPPITADGDLSADFHATGDTSDAADTAESQIENALAEIKHAHGTLLKELKRPWRSLIAAHCMKASPFDFPQWVLQKLGDDELVLHCLEAEFGKDKLEALYTKSKQAVHYKLSECLQLSDPRLLALYFGGDGVRPPSVVSLKHIFNLIDNIETDDDRDVTKSWQDLYAYMITNWAGRMGLDLESPKDRLRCVFARLPFSDQKAGQRARLSPKDCPKPLDGDRDLGEPSPSDPSADWEAHTNALGGQEESQAPNDGERSNAADNGASNATKPAISPPDFAASTGLGIINPEPSTPKPQTQTDSYSDFQLDDSPLRPSIKGASTGLGIANEEPSTPKAQMQTDSYSDLELDDSPFQSPTRSYGTWGCATSWLNAITLPSHPSSPLPSPPEWLKPRQAAPNTALDPTPTTSSSTTPLPEPAIQSSEVTMDTTPSAAKVVDTDVTTAGANGASDPKPDSGQQHPLAEISDKTNVVEDQLSPRNSSRPVTPSMAILDKTNVVENQSDKTNAIENRLSPHNSSRPITPSTTSSTNSPESSIQLGRGVDSTQGFELTPPTPMDGSTFSPVSGLKRSADLVLETPKVKKAKLEHATATPEKSGSPSVVQLKVDGVECIVIEDDDVTVKPAGSYMIQNLERPQEKLHGHVVSHLLTMVTSVRRSYRSMTPTVGEGENKGEINRLARLQAKMAEDGVTNILLCVNISMSHWVAVAISDTSIGVYDSLPGSALGFLRELFASYASMKKIGAEPCPVQMDSYSCGVFALVVSFFLISGKDLPFSLEIDLWRRLLLAMVRKSSLGSVLAADVLAVVHPEQSAVVRPTVNQPVAAKPVEQARLLALEARRLSQTAQAAAARCISWYLPRGREVERVMSWLDEEVSPVITALAELAVGEVAQLTQDIADVSEEMAMYKETIANMAKAKFAPAGSLVSGAMDNVARLELIHRRFMWRLESVKTADTAFRCLELGQLREQLGRTKAEYEAEVSEAKAVSDL